MPELKAFPDVKVRDLKVGDMTTYGKVLDKDVKVKWAIVTFQGQAGPYTERLLADDALGCSREVATEAEQAAKLLAHMLVSLDHKEAQARRTLEHARESMIKALQAGERANHWSWMDVPLAEATVELWDAVTHVHQVHAMKAVFEGGEGVWAITRVEAVKLVLEERSKKALSYYRGLSRSTSVISNLFEDIEREALSAWARELEWIVD